MTEPKDEYIARMQKKLEEWNMGLDELQTRVDLAEASAQDERGQRLARLRDEFDAARNRMSSLEDLGPEEWNDFREGMEEARKLLDQGIEQARSSDDG